MPGSFVFMLHSHIPYCRKSGTWPAGEEWLFEAMNEAYIPLLKVFRSLYFDSVPAKIMVGIVPVLMEQLNDPYMKDRFCSYMEDKILRAQHDVKRFAHDPLKHRAAEYWLQTFTDNYRAYTADFYCDLLGTFRWLQEVHMVEVLTSAATHGFLPLLENDSAVFTQIHVGVETYKRYFSRPPRGFWLPECAYRPDEWSDRGKRLRPGIDAWLAGEGIEYFFVENVGITRASFLENRHQESGPTTFRGYRLASGVSVFGRNEETGKQVWSPDHGYPGDPYYLEFHSKDPDSGLHYWRVTGGPEKRVYEPDAAAHRAEEHARHFVSLLKDTLKGNAFADGEPIIVAPYDCELFGHWWHEGPAWIDKVFRCLAGEETVKKTNLGEYLDVHGRDFSTISMQPSTWGLNSDYTVWKKPEHGWIWPYINSCSSQMEELLARLPGPLDERGSRIMRQLARELLLMQGSDWPFLLFTTQAKEYANQRFHHHHQRFQKLMWAAKDLGDPGRLPEAELIKMEDIDCPWPDIDWQLFSRR
jgi:1,4-alpha-glucan branching enzyme